MFRFLVCFIFAVQCGTHAQEEVHLTGSRTPFEGRVEISYNGDRGLICNEGWDMNDSDVTCRQFGYDMGAMFATAEKTWLTDIGYYISEVDCQGNEDNVLHCPRRHISSGGCGINDEARVTCNVPGYLGCFPANDNPSFPESGGWKYIISSMTIEACTEYCRSIDHVFGALKFARECYCSNDATGLLTAPSANEKCYSKCGGNEHQACGGYDYLSVYDTRYGSCGQSPNLVITPTPTAMETTDSGTVVSPGFPGTYPANSDCQWVLQVDPRRTITIHFVMFELSRDTNDWLEFRDGPSNGDPLITRIQGNQYGEGMLPASINSSSSAVLLIFHSNSGTEDRGFVVNYEAVAVTSSGGLTKGTIQGLIVGSVCFVAMVILFTVLFIHWRRKRSKDQDEPTATVEANELERVDNNYDVDLNESKNGPYTGITEIPSYHTVGENSDGGNMANRANTSEAGITTVTQPLTASELPEYATVDKDRKLSKEHLSNSSESIDEKTPMRPTPPPQDISSSGSSTESDEDEMVENVLHQKAETYV